MNKNIVAKYGLAMIGKNSIISFQTDNLELCISKYNQCSLWNRLRDENKQINIDILDCIVFRKGYVDNGKIKLVGNGEILAQLSKGDKFTRETEKKRLDVYTNRK